MQLAALTVALAEFFLIGLLPRIFFRKDGRYNFMWFVTAAPYLLSAVGLILSYLGVLPSWINPAHPAAAPLEALGALLATGAVGLTFLTIGSHRVPLALWHQDNDAPRSIVTWGAYKHIRHPFYASFLLALTAALLIAPSAVTTFTLVYGLVMMNSTAAREEARLSASAFGAEYRAYRLRTGRFFPRFSFAQGSGARSTLASSRQDG